MTPLFRKFIGMNWVLFFTMVGLLIFGVSAIYSASWMREGVHAALRDKWRTQAILAIAGLVPYFLASLVDYKWMKWLALPFYSLGMLLLLLLFVVGGDSDGVVSSGEVYEQTLSLSLGPLSFQPSQVAMAGGIVLIALILSHLHRIHPFFRNPFVRLCLAGMVGAIPCLIVLKQGDFGSAFVWLPVVGAMFLVGNIPFRYLITIVLIGTLVIPYGYYFGLKEYQKRRITVQFDMLMGKKVDTLGAAYSAHNNLLAIGSAGFTGKGFKSEDTVNAKGFISPPTAINDFIFVVLAEEHGFRGAVLLLSAFLLLLLQCLFVAFYSRDMFGRLIVVGVVGLIFAHIFQNVGMDLLIMPITGIPLPLISYGGTFIIIVMSLLGLVQSVWVHRNVAEKSRNQPGMPEHKAMDIEGVA